MLLQVSTKYSKHHNHHHLNNYKVVILRCNPEIKPNNTTQSVTVALLGATSIDGTLTKAYYL